MRAPNQQARANRDRTLLRRAAIVVVLLVAGFGMQRSLGDAPTSYPGHYANSGPRYLSPTALKLSPDGKRLYVVCEGTGAVLAVDTRTQRVVGEAKVGRRPEGITTSPDGKILYVSNEWSNTVTEINAASLLPLRTLKTGWGPAGITTDQVGKFLYTADTSGNNISVIDLQTGREVKRLDAGHFPEYVALSRDGQSIYISNLLAQVAPPDEPPISELTVVDTEKQIVSRRISVPGVIQLRHIAEVPEREGGYLLVPFLQPHNLIPLIQIQQGWYMSHGLAIVRLPLRGERRPRVVQILLDDIDRSYADGFGVSCTPDGRLALITASGANIVSIIDIAKLNRLLQRVPAAQPDALANRLDSAQQFVVRRLRTGRNPTAVVVSTDSRFAYIANRTDDTVTVIDLQQLKVSSTIDLGGPKEVTAERRGQQLFYDASFCYQGQLACASCHPHQGFEDGLAWSLETPELGHDVVENRTLLAISETSPFKWNGMNRDLATQDGPRTAMYIFRSQGFSPEEVKDLVSYIRSLELPPNPHIPPDGHLNEVQARGRELFYRTRTNDGNLIPIRDRCYYCHAALSHYTSRVRMDVGTSTQYDTVKEFDVPQLEGVYMRPPYLHNGEALTLEEIWTKFNPKDQHGFTSDMNKVQLNDLIEFLKTL